MASTTTDGVVLEVPYAIIRNIRNQRPWTLTVIGRDPRQAAHNQKQLRSFPASSAAAASGIFVYAGDVITFALHAPVNASDAAAYDLYSVNPSTGVETKVTEIGFSQIWQMQSTVTVDAIDPTTGAVSFTNAWS